MPALRSFAPLDRLRDSLRSGAWLTPERLRVYPAMLGGALGLAIVLLVATSHGGLDLWHRPLGTDFAGVWVAGREVLAGRSALPYDNAAAAAAQAAAFGPSDSFLPWPYPPTMLALAALVGTVPYLVALALFQGVTLLAYLRVVVGAGRGLPRRRLVVAALAFPAVAINLLHGQNGLLSAALLAGGTLLLPKRPLLAGGVFALLAYKPQFALAVPVALLAGRQWRAVCAAIVVGMAMTGLTLVAFGVAPWQGFVGGLGFARRVILEQGGLESYKLQSAFAAVRLLGGSVALAYGIQALASCLALAGLASVWRGGADIRLKIAALATASLLSTPYVVDYDLTILGPALAALASHGLERGFRPYGKSLLAVAWIMPLVARTTAMLTNLPVGWAVLAALFAAIVSWARPARSIEPASARSVTAAI